MMTQPQTKPLVSVILPVYNGAEFIGAALDSARSQTYAELEIIVVDDGSTDETRSILDAHAAADARVRVIGQENGGVARARNRAIAEARGEFIAPLDADDLWLPDKIERQVRRMIAAGDDTGFVYSWWAWIDAEGAVLDRSPCWNIEGRALEKLIFINFTGNASVPLFRSHCLRETGGYNEQLAATNAGGCEDWDVALRVAERYKVAVVPEVLLGYRRRPGSMSSACDTMWRSQQHVMEGIRALRPDLQLALFRASENQFAMYLAGVSFWAGNLQLALRWALRTGVRLPLLVAPYALRILLTRRRATPAQRMKPGAALDTERISGPLLPYDRIDTNAVFVSLARAVAHLVLGPAIVRIIHTMQWGVETLLLVRLRLEAALRGRDTQRGVRVLATACWYFPIYSQTFVYREVLALIHAGFNVRFAYAALTSRTQLPDDCAALWPVRRRMQFSDATAARDLKRYRKRMPERVNQLVRQISEASGLTEAQVLAHRHFRYAFTFARMAEAWKPDYLHTYFFYEGALYGLVASALLGIPHGVSCYADHMLDDYELKVPRLHVDYADVIVATSSRIKNELETIAGRDLPCAIVKPNGIAASGYAHTEREPSRAGRVFRIVAVNRIHPKKGLSFLLEAALQLRSGGHSFVLDILGEDDKHDLDGQTYFDQLKTFVADREIGEQVFFRGRQTAPEVRRALETADIFVAPFVELPNGDKDGIPTALLEAMAAGCAIVATDAGSMLEVIDDGVEGFIVPQYDSAALAAAIARLLGDDGLRTRLAIAAVERVRRQFDVSHCEDIFHERIRAVVAARQRPEVSAP